MTKTNKQKLKIAIIFNLIIVIFEIVGVVLSVKRHGAKVFLFYTENSNYFAGLVSFIFCATGIVSLKKNKRIDDWVCVLRFVSTVCLLVTLVVVSCVFIPMFPKTAEGMLLKNSNLYEHFLCPVLSLLSFLFFENNFKLSKKYFWWALFPTVIYGVLIVLFNVLKIVKGPYPFLFVYEIKWWICALFLLGILLIAATLDFILFVSHNKICIKSKKTI